MDEAKQQITNRKAVKGQVGSNYGTVNIHIDGRRKKQRSPSPPSRVWTVPYLRNQVFTAREDLLLELHHRLTTSRTAALTQPQAISGLGGIGKTQVAIEYAYRYHEEYHYILWINAANRETLISGLLELAVLFDLPQQHEQEQTKVITAVKQWFISHRSWLLIFDNADDLDLADEFLPPGTTGHILLTTRQQATGTLAASLMVETMNIQEGTLLILHRTKVLNIDAPLEQAQPEDRKHAERIVRAMDGLPLALDQAGAYIEETQCSLAMYHETYQQRQTELLRRRGTTGKAHSETVATTWSLSFAKVEQLNPLAADLLRCCAFLAPDDIPEQLLRDGASELGPLLQAIEKTPSLLDEAIGTLLRFSFVKRKLDEQTVVVHRLVQSMQRTRMDAHTQHIWAERTVRAVNHAFPDRVDYRNWSQCQLYLPHALACDALITAENLTFPEVAHLLNQTACYLNDRAQYPQALPLYEHALAIREKSLGAEHPDTARSLNNLALLYQTQGNYAQALPLYERALAIREKALGTDHLDTARSLNNLA